VAYVLARLYEETGDTSFLVAAEQGALHLQKIATVRGDSALISYRYPDLPDLYYLGFCHGPAGTATLFYQLYKVTNNMNYLDWTQRFARGVITSNIPDRLTPGFWNVVCQCCGSAGVTDFFLGLWAATGKTEYYAFANRVADQALSRQTNIDGNGYRWYQAWTRVKPWEVTAGTGYSIGASGVGTALLHAALAQKGQYQAILFPDNPFPNRRNEDLKADQGKSASAFQYLS
jgi:lantibiotic modifying enzyme